MLPHYFHVNQASNSENLRILDSTVPACSGEEQNGATPLFRSFEALGSIPSLWRKREVRSAIELWVLEAVLFSFALLRRMGYQ